MSVLYYLIPISAVFMLIAVGGFFWAIRSGQYEDLEGPAWRILNEDDSKPKS